MDVGWARPRDLVHTNLAFYLQLEQLGWGEADLVRARDAYGLVTDLFSGRLRRNGNTFIAHVVGTASLCASYNGRPDVVLAGLLHAAYTVGEFGDSRRVLHPGQRRVVRDVIGDESEELVHAFATLRWTPESVAALTVRAAELSARERDSVFIRLVNEVEQQSDLGARFQPPRAGYPTDAAMITLAEHLPWPEIAHDLRIVCGVAADHPVPASLVRGESAPILTAPRSFRPRRLLAAGRLLHGARRRVARQVGRWVGRSDDVAPPPAAPPAGPNRPTRR